MAPHHLATAAGLSILRAGGSAVDAAIATNAALGVVMPSGCGIGGDAFWLIWDEATQHQSALNGSGRAPAAADAAALRARGLDRIPLRGPLSISVPGAVRSWGDAHARHGRLPLSTVLAPAIELARDGFPAWDGFIGAVEATAPNVIRDIGPDAGFLAVYRPEGRPWRPGERVRLPALAATLEALATDGTDAFYDGDLGERQAQRPGGGRQSDRRGGPARPHEHLGRPDRDRLPRRPRHDPPAEQLRARRPRDPGDPRPVRGAGAPTPSGRPA